MLFRIHVGTIMLQRIQLSIDGCLKVLLTCMLCIVGMLAIENNFCKFMCQIEGSTSNCEGLLEVYALNENLARLNFMCCLDNGFFADHINFTARLSTEFSEYLVNETDKLNLIKYSYCIGDCSSESYELTKEDCDTNNPTKCTDKCDA